MENITEPNESFDFSKLSLAHPTGIQGGAYFTKILHNSKPLYIQTVKSLTRQGVVKSGKKYYCDLMFDNNAEALIRWFENLEEKCQQLLFEKNQDWFQNSLNINDIESAFNSVLRVYKSGKYYLVRTNIKNNITNDPNIKIFNENEVTLGVANITNETNIISILEVQGIKFTSRSFQIDIDLKQVMVLDNEPIFDNCVIKTSTKKPTPTLEIVTSPMVQYEASDKVNEVLIDNINETADAYPIDLVDKTNDDIGENPEVMFKDETEDESTSFDLDVEELDTEEIKELRDLDINNSLETLTLKKPNEVYFELYKEARNKAKEAKKSAIIAYLEAKNIKKTYMLENINDSDSDFDAEIDEVSESELEGL
jgi:hypothetical protein